MSHINFLSKDDFIVMGTKDKTLGIQAKGVVLVFFKMQNCPNCAEFEPIFAKLAHKENRVIPAICDISQNREVALTSRNTNTPIVAVPLIILYINGRPHAMFKGQKNIPSLQKFITNALQAPTIQKTEQKQFMSTEQESRTQNKKAYVPDIGRSPSLKGIIKGNTRGGYASGPNVEEDDEPRLAMPGSVIPHNAPWEAELSNQEYQDE